MSFDAKIRGRPGGYYYRSVRVNGRPLKLYVGTGLAAELAARVVAGRRRERLALAAEREEHAAALAALDVVLDWLAPLVRAELLLRGYYAHKGQWRPRGRTARRGPPPPRAT